MKDRNALVESGGIDRKDMAKFSHGVQDLVLHLVNAKGIRWRSAPSSHVLLYPPDGVGRPFKISPSRPAESTIKFITRQFMAVYDIDDPDGNVPGKEAEVAVTEAKTMPMGYGPEDAAEAVRTLATALGVSLGGTVSEEDYLAVVAEKDYCSSQMTQLVERVEGLVADVEARDASLAALTEQRDRLLEAMVVANQTLEQGIGRS